MNVGDKIRNYCSSCCKHTNHIVLYSKDAQLDDFYHEITCYGVIQCAGCDSISYRTENIDYDVQIQDEEGDWGPNTTVENFPKFLKGHKQAIHKYHLPEKIGTVYIEAIKAFSSECYLLTGVAFRAVIEAICLDKGITGKSLDTKITNLSKSKLITDKEAGKSLLTFLASE